MTGEAITIHQTDHFGLAHTPLSCTAAPIHDTRGQLTAVLDISLLRSPSPKSSQNLALSLVTASVRRVEMANLMASSRRDWVLRFSTSPEFLDVDPEAAVALDGSGRIIGMTKGAEALVRSGSGPLLGRAIGDLLDLSVDDLPDLMRGRPTEERVLRLRDGRALFGHAIAPQHAPLPARARGQADLGALAGICGPDPALENLAQRAARLARARVPVLIRGESGAGKDYLARAMHVSGPAGRALHVLRCAGLRAEAVAAAGAAAPGTLLLRGLDDLSPEAQAALLDLLDRRDDLRVIALAGPDPEETRLALRDDLFFRLSGATLTLPPLRLRRDFDWLLDRLFRRRAPEEMRLTPAARIELAGRDWPGNIRELAQTLDVALALADGTAIDLPDLPLPAAARPVEASGPDLAALLEACHGNMAQMARRLGVNRSTVLRRLRKAGLSPPD